MGYGNNLHLPRLLESICRDTVAPEIHKLVTTRNLPNGVRTTDRTKLFPSIYKDRSEQTTTDGLAGEKSEQSTASNAYDETVVQAILEKYGVDDGTVTGTTTTTNKRSGTRLLTNRSKVLITDNRSNEKGRSSTSPLDERGERDIWGNVPSKEPKELLPCPVCEQMLKTSRFAPHLAECMGLDQLVHTKGNTTTNGNKDKQRPNPRK
jgi:Sgf11 (transcriptional regulation protein)